MDSRRAWIVVSAAFVAMGLVFGASFSAATVLDAMAEEHGASSGAVAVPFALAAGLPFLLAPFAGRAVDRFGPRALLVASAAIAASGLALAAAAPSFALGAAAFGVGLGGGAACLFTPLTATVGRWFVRRRALALGVTGAGASLGTLALAPAVAAVVHAHGYAAACVALAVTIATVLPLCALAISRPPVPAPAAEDRLTLRELSARPGFRRLYVTVMIASAGPYVPFAFVAPAAIADGVSPVAAGALVSVLGGAALAGRLAGPLLGERLGLRRVLRATIVLLGLALLAWPLCGGSLPALVAFATVFGASYGAGAVAFQAVAADDLGPVAMARGLGVLFTASGIGVTAGPLLAGGLVAVSGDHALAGFVIGALLLAGSRVAPAPEPRTSRQPAFAY